MRKAVGVLALTLALTCSAYAGETQNGVAGTPPPPPPSRPAQMQTTEGESRYGATVSIVKIVLDLLTLF